jgi:NADH-quinone oxidoreductase subunit N
MEITAPNIEYGLLMPFILIFAGACLGVLVEGFVPRTIRRVAQLTIVYAAIAAALFMTLRNWAVHPPTVAAEGSVSVDGPTRSCGSSC